MGLQECIEIFFLLEVIAKYRDKISSLEPDVKDIEQTEREEKELRATENQINKANNLLENKEQDPKREWFQTHKERMQEKGTRFNYLSGCQEILFTLKLFYLSNQNALSV